MTAGKREFLLDARKLLAKAVENWPAKVLSIALAIILFVFHRMSTLTERFFSVPLVMESQTNLVPAVPYPRMIRVTLRGDPNSIYHVQEEDIEAYIDLSRFSSPGNYQAAVQIHKTGTALDVSPLEIGIEPGEISLSLDMKISKVVPLKAIMRGEVVSGYILNSHSLYPPQVIIDGPSRLVGFISELETEVIDLGSRTTDFSESVTIRNQDPLISVRGSGYVEFQGNISRIIPVRNIQNIAVRMVGLDASLSGEMGVRYVSVHLEGRNQEQLDRFSLPLEFLYVDCSAITEPGTYMLAIYGDVPSGISLSTDPNEIMIRIYPAEVND